MKVVILQSGFRGCLARRRVKRMREFSMECARVMSSDELRREKDASCKYDWWIRHTSDSISCS